MVLRRLVRRPLVLLLALSVTASLVTLALVGHLHIPAWAVLALTLPEDAYAGYLTYLEYKRLRR